MSQNATSAISKCLICSHSLKIKHDTTSGNNKEKNGTSRSSEVNSEQPKKRTSNDALIAFSKGLTCFWKLSNNTEEEGSGGSGKELAKVLMNLIPLKPNYNNNENNVRGFDLPCCKRCLKNLAELQGLQGIIEESQDYQQRLIQKLQKYFTSEAFNPQINDQWKPLRELLCGKKNNEDFDEEDTNQGDDEDSSGSSQSSHSPTKSVDEATNNHKEEKENLPGCSKDVGRVETEPKKKKRSIFLYETEGMTLRPNRSTKRPRAPSPSKDKPKAKRSYTKRQTKEPPQKRRKTETRSPHGQQFTLEDRIKDAQEGNVSYCDGCNKGLINAQYYMCIDPSCLVYDEKNGLGTDLCGPCFASGLHSHHKFVKVYHFLKFSKETKAPKYHFMVANSKQSENNDTVS